MGVRLRVVTPRKEPTYLAGQAEESALAGRDDLRSATSLPYEQQPHFIEACERDDHCQCYEDGLQCCTCYRRQGSPIPGGSRLNYCQSCGAYSDQPHHKWCKDVHPHVPPSPNTCECALNAQWFQPTHA